MMDHKVHAIMVIFALAFLAFAALVPARSALNPAMEKLVEGYDYIAYMLSL